VGPKPVGSDRGSAGCEPAIEIWGILLSVSTACTGLALARVRKRGGSRAQTPGRSSAKLGVRVLKPRGAVVQNWGFACSNPGRIIISKSCCIRDARVRRRNPRSDSRFRRRTRLTRHAVHKTEFCLLWHSARSQECLEGPRSRRIGRQCVNIVLSHPCESAQERLDAFLLELDHRLRFRV
jgi:hypothetical protein